MQAFIAYSVGMIRTHIQYTIRRVPKRLDDVLRQKAKSEHKSLNEIAVEALKKGAGIDGETQTYHDLDELAGTWIQDDEFDRAIEAMDQVDLELWK